MRDDIWGLILAAALIALCAAAVLAVLVVMGWVR